MINLLEEYNNTGMRFRDTPVNFTRELVAVPELTEKNFEILVDKVNELIDEVNRLSGNRMVGKPEVSDEV